MTTDLETFSANFYCKNCYAEMTFEFPVGTKIVRAPYIGYDGAESRVIISHAGKAAEHIPLKCKFCKIGNVA